MNAPHPPTGSRHHPMMIVAAGAVVLLCLTGTAAIMGWVPSSTSGNSSASRGELGEADRMALAAKLTAPAPSTYQQRPAPSPSPPPSPSPSPTYAAMPPAAPQSVQRSTPAPNYRPEQVAAAAPAKNRCNNCGNVESVREITTRAQGSGIGAAGGAVLGGLLGNQIGGGNGRQLATVAGAVGGAVVGNQVEGNIKATHRYEIRVRLDDDTTRTFHQQNVPGWRSGDRVRVIQGVLHSVR